MPGDADEREQFVGPHQPHQFVSQVEELSFGGVRRRSRVFHAGLAEVAQFQFQLIDASLPARVPQPLVRRRTLSLRPQKYRNSAAALSIDKLTICV